MDDTQPVHLTYEWETRAKSFRWPARLSHRIRKTRQDVRKSFSSEYVHVKRAKSDSG